MSARNSIALPAGLNVLVVDDVAATRGLMSWIMRELNCALVVECHNGEEAIAEFEAMRPAITFLDIEMPGMDGLQVLQRLKEVDPKAFIVIASGCSSVGNVQRALETGASGFIVKPFSVSKVADIFLKYAQQPGRSTSFAPSAA